MEVPTLPDRHKLYDRLRHALAVLSAGRDEEGKHNPVQPAHRARAEKQSQVLLNAIALAGLKLTEDYPCCHRCGAQVNAYLTGAEAQTLRDFAELTADRMAADNKIEQERFLMQEAQKNK